MSTIAHKLQAVATAIQAASKACGRDPAAVQLLAVSKTFPAAQVLEAIAAGQHAFGENYLQEALDKIADIKAAVPAEPVEWHFIGPIQSNKTRPIAASFDWVHTVERLKVAQRLSEQRPAGMAPLNVCIQVNISGEASKSGVAPGELPELARQVALLPNLTLRGLMAIPEPEIDAARQRAAFARLRALADALRAGGLELDTLSMGMSADMAAAIAEGATIVRVGSAIFGLRNHD
ncbi:YggS family pyridoxal phosphate-dependent enzyme [Massilia psychrophila]|uniref:Pyridoxal phosphate homeostasis protein n=1 Tax=Massilia psychrophila TaxID=1603353 RepID=A0A2G8T2D6_9BURK|nr:YggS family pyridoxal phosphate-dependent enzyme [Massilia psychrophila]PIL40174.1 YggS family pyridoxal phosphate-dependent enzyme [Massilia psychrophila]GGE70561.1 YggS family pyridoxal phosphate enzyme [Massilia psychrophila]